MAPKKAKSKSNASPAPDPAPAKKNPKRNIVKSGNAGSSGKRDAGNNDQEQQSEKKSIFGDWTGKTPVSLLHEHCQKQGWEKPTFDMSKTKNGFIGTVQLGKRNKKTAQIQTLHLRPPNECALPTALEARHLAATFALHRVNSHMPMHRVLPPQFRDYWHQFETYKTKNNAWQYAPDPFAAQPPQPKATTADKRPVKEHASAAVPLPQSSNTKNSTQKTTSTRPKAVDERTLKYWESLPVVHMSTDNRELVEQVIKNSNVIYQKRTEDIPPEELQEIKEGLVDMGFRPSHVEEAMEYCDSTATALDWLCLHVPEDDLPPAFMHAGYNPTMTTISHTTQSLGRDWMIKKLTSVGYSVKICQEAMEQCNDNDLKALEVMQWRLVHGNQEMPSEKEEKIDASELETTRQEEVVALESIYGSRFQIVSEESQNDRQHYSIRISSQQISSDITLKIIIPTQSQYPHTVPIFAVQCDELPAYIKLSIIKGVVVEAENNLGMPMIYMCAEWLQENIDQMIANPPKLHDVTEGIANLVTLPSTNKKRKAQQGRPAWETKKRGNSKELKEALQQLHASDEYAPFKESRARLPADAFKREILKAVSRNQITIVSGETGCGKTTQVPQFILDQEIELERGENCNIVCTQPRKVAAIGVAERVAAERCEPIGKSVGYAVRGETKASADTRLQFVTTGVLLRRLHSDPNLEGISHVMVDEVHERSVDSDFLLILLKRLLGKRKDLKVVLMSATINQQLFSEYFGGAPCIEIPGFTHPVQDFYLEDIVSMTKFVSRMPTPNRDREDKESTGGEWAQWQIKLLEAGFDEQTVRTLSRYRNQLSIDYDLVAHTVRHIVTMDTLKLENGAQPAILIFMPGAMEIRRCIETMQSVLGRSEDYEILPLHANLSPQEQTQVFKPVPRNVFKIVVATNVAETSITIDGVVYVIDCGRVKETQYDSATNMMHLVETWASRASCKQRRGRAGRTRPGQCFKLFMRDTEANKMSPQQMPEILRTPLEQLCLQVKAMGEQDVRAFLGKAIDPPSTKALENAINTLQAVEAIQDGKSGELTPLGKHMASIPADLRIGKMLLLGSIFRCLEPVLTIAAIMSLKSPFTSPMDKREEARQCRERFSLGKSDWLTDMKAFEKWQQIREGKGMREARQFCEENFLSLPTLLEIQSLRRQYADALAEIGFYNRQSNEHFNVNSDNFNLIKSIIFGGLNPNVAKIKMPDTKYDKVLAGTVEREKDAREIKYYVKDEGRVFLHPSSILFNNNSYNSLFLTYFSRMTTSKTFIRDGTEVPAYAILFFGGKVDVDHFGRGLQVGQDGWIKLRAWARIGVLVNQLKRLLLAELDIKIQDPSVDVSSSKVVQTMIALISSDGL